MTSSGWPRRFAEHALRLASFFCLVALCVALLNPSLKPGEKFSLLYSAPLYGAFFWWLYCRLREGVKFSAATTLIDLTAVGLAASRLFGTLIPSSGHALFLTYSLITVNSRLYRIAAAVMLAATVAVKLYWGDYRSWGYGILAGALLGAGYLVTVRKSVAKAQPLR